MLPGRRASGGGELGGSGVSGRESHPPLPIRVAQTRPLEGLGFLTAPPRPQLSILPEGRGETFTKVISFQSPATPRKQGGGRAGTAPESGLFTRGRGAWPRDSDSVAQTLSFFPWEPRASLPPVEALSATVTALCGRPCAQPASPRTHTPKGLKHHNLGPAFLSFSAFLPRGKV